jgi:hypothetical protein
MNTIVSYLRLILGNVNVGYPLPLLFTIPWFYVTVKEIF